MYWNVDRTSALPARTTTVCSKCALGLPSRVTTVHPSLSLLHFLHAHVDHGFDGQRHAAHAAALRARAYRSSALRVLRAACGQRRAPPVPAPLRSHWLSACCWIAKPMSPVRLFSTACAIPNARHSCVTRNKLSRSPVPLHLHRRCRRCRRRTRSSAHRNPRWRRRHPVNGTVARQPMDHLLVHTGQQRARTAVQAFEARHCTVVADELFRQSRQVYRW